MSNVSDGAQRAKLGSKVLVIGLLAIFTFAMLGFALAVVDSEPAPTAPPPPSLPALLDLEASSASSAAAAAPRFLLALAQTSPATPSPASAEVPAAPVASTSPAPSPESAATVAASEMPVVPVVGFWSRADGLKRAKIRRALATGELKGYRGVVVEERIADALQARLGIELDDHVRTVDADRLATAVSKGALGLVAASSLRPSLRALDVDGVSLRGNDRVGDVADWPLTVTLELAPEDAWDQSQTWVLVAGGDAFTDRGVYERVVREGKGVDYPFDGGTATVTGHGCCDPVFHDNVVPRYRLTGDRGAVRRLFRRAELAIVNHEQPVTDGWAHHRSGLRFSGKPDLTRIFTRAGIDFVSLANNHIGDYGATGISDTRRILRQHDLGFGGAGKDLAQARKVQPLDARGTSVAIIPCLDIVKVYWAENDRPGATPCVDQYIKKDIRKARRAGADVVIVFPHWGVEYTRQPLDSMRKHAQRWIEAGATMVLGSHSHVAGAIEDVDGAPVVYSLGNLVFDQNWSTNTMESALLEATFNGDQLVDMRLRPYIIHDTSQPNFLDPDKGEGRRLLQQVKQASSAWLQW